MGKLTGALRLFSYLVFLGYIHNYISFIFHIIRSCTDYGIRIYDEVKSCTHFAIAMFVNFTKQATFSRAIMPRQQEGDSLVRTTLQRAVSLKARVPKRKNRAQKCIDRVSGLQAVHGTDTALLCCRAIASPLQLHQVVATRANFVRAYR